LINRDAAGLRLTGPARVSILALVMAAFSLAWTSTARGAPPDPGRHQVLTVTSTVHVWWLTEWKDNQVICNVYVDHDGLPSRDEILQSCGGETYDRWMGSSPCAASESQTASGSCKGLYLHDAGKDIVQRMVTVDLPLPDVSLTLEGCDPTPPTNSCSEVPRILLKAIEPLPNEHILRIRGSLDGVGFDCESDSCLVDVGPTRPEGATLYFWADSSFGDSSPHFQAEIRIATLQPLGSANQTWYVDVLSSQWDGPAPPACSVIWDAFPPAGGPPVWLSTPELSVCLFDRHTDKAGTARRLRMPGFGPVAQRGRRRLRD
jgi:hypothetical protein